VSSAISVLATNDTRGSSVRHLSNALAAAFVAVSLGVSSYRLRSAMDETFPQLSRRVANLMKQQIDDVEMFVTHKRVTQPNISSSSQHQANPSIVSPPLTKTSGSIAALKNVKYLRSATNQDNTSKGFISQSRRVLLSSDETKEIRSRVTIGNFKRESQTRELTMLRRLQYSRLKLTRIIFISPVLGGLAFAIPIAIFVLTIDSRSFSESYRNEKAQYNSASDATHYLVILIVFLYEWYSHVPSLIKETMACYGNTVCCWLSPLQ